MKRFGVMTLIVVLVAALAIPALAEPGATPNGPFISDNQEVMLEGFTDYEEMVKELKQIEKNSKGVVRLEVVGQSYEGRDIYLVRAGLGEDDVMIISQQHGNEPHGTEAVLQLIKNIASSGSPEFKAIRENLTVNVIPKLNPDGATHWHRYVLDPTAPNARTFSQETGFVDPDTGATPSRLNNETYGMYSYAGLGWDSNRFHFVDWTTSPMYYYWPDIWPENPAGEADICAKTVKMLVDEGNKPLWFADLHNQGSTIDENGDLIMFALDTAHYTNDWDTDYTYPLVQQASRMLVAIKDAIKSPNTAISRYAAPSAFAGRSRNQYMQVYDIPGILIEMRGMGQKQSGKINQLCYDTLIPILMGTIDGSIDDIDWERVFEITTYTRSYNRDIPANPNDDE